jgi:hypothetical protein
LLVKKGKTEINPHQQGGGDGAIRLLQAVHPQSLKN